VDMSALLLDGGRQIVKGKRQVGLEGDGQD
jgi:hypothetical protein